MKFREIRSSGDIFKKQIRFVRGAMEFLDSIGFKEEASIIRFGDENTSLDENSPELADLRFALDLVMNI